MEYATKYALVPEEDFTKHVPTKKHMTEFDLAMSKILNSSLPDHEKVRQYYELLKRKMDLQEYNVPWMKSEKKEEDPQKKESDPTANQENKEDYDLFIISSAPKNMRKQAESLLNLLKSNSNVFQWDNRGTVTYKGQKLNESNLAELFHLIFSVNRKPPVPAQSEFLQALQELGVRPSVIKNKFLLNKAKPQKKKIRKSVESSWLSL